MVICDILSQASVAVTERCRLSLWRNFSSHPVGSLPFSIAVYADYMIIIEVLQVLAVVQIVLCRLEPIIFERN